jgi:hypothetical protein
MAKNVFFSKEPLNEMDKILEANPEKAVMEFGKSNFLFGVATAAIYGATALAVYKVSKLTVSLVKYFKS